MLGSFNLSWDDEPRLLPLSSTRLLCLLALSGRRLQRSTIAGTLWPDKTDERATANLRLAVWRMPDHGASILRAAKGIVQLSDQVATDVEAVERKSVRLIARGREV